MKIQEFVGVFKIYNGHTTRSWRIWAVGCTSVHSWRKVQPISGLPLGEIRQFFIQQQGRLILTKTLHTDDQVWHRIHEVCEEQRRAKLQKDNVDVDLSWCCGERFTSVDDLCDHFAAHHCIHECHRRMLEVYDDGSIDLYRNVKDPLTNKPQWTPNNEFAPLRPCNF